MRSLHLAALCAALGASATAHAQSIADRLSLHGYLTQGFGAASTIPIVGLNRDPSGDYRAAALQIRYAVTPEGSFVVQGGTRALGTSPLGSTPGDVTIDWAFYSHKFSENAVRVGRVPLPFGLFNETREVGTIVPFYRAPINYYIEGFRSLDGAMLVNTHAIGGGSLETTIFGGGFDGRLAVWLPTTVIPAKARFERTIGTQAIYTTPLEGLRFIGTLATFRGLDTAKVQAAPAAKYGVLSGGVDGTFDRVYGRGEWRRIKNGSNSRSYNYYGQTGVRVINQLWINGQGDFAESSNNSATGYHDILTQADRALGLSYGFGSSVVGKLEQHWVHGRSVDAYIAASAPMPYTSYGIASVSVSF